MPDAPGGDTVLAAPLLPLFPFQTAGEARAWMTAYRAKGARPEFADPGPTALAFARFLGYTEVDRVTATTTDAKGAHVSVGSLVPETQQASTAAVVHLVRYLPRVDAPWEVVGTDDTTFSLTEPAYGARGGVPARRGWPDHRSRREHPRPGATAARRCPARRAVLSRGRR